MRPLTAGPAIRLSAAAMLPAEPAVATAPPPPVEYAEAVSRYLASCTLSAGSRRVYLISLTGWAWPLVGRRPPPRNERRGAAPPIVPLAVLDEAAAGPRLAAAYADRAASAGPRTVNRELSALRSAIGWWLDQQWIQTDPTAGLRHLARRPAALPPLTPDQVTSLFRTAPGLREHAFWRVLYDSGAPAEDVLGLDVGRLDLLHHRARLPSGPGGPARQGGPAGPGGHRWIYWREGSTQLLRWLLAGRPQGPVFLTGRRAAAGSDPAHICPLTGRARMSYRRAAEIFTAATRPLDPAGRGWTLYQLRHAQGQPQGS